ncbi:hypothetical protein MPSEU_000272300 [Mayamaea pseudoterrestris]|nr:hypothetical protein MPSEU_000272300 [Mayamaea pseudoterrestris]
MNMKPSALALDTDTNGINAWKPNKDVGNLRRRTEDIEYWRQRAGWFNDDESMREYNQGVYDTYYEIDDDGSGRNHRSRLGSSKQREIAKNVLKVTAVLVALGLLVLMCKTLMRRLGSSKREKVSSDSKSRSGRSKSRSRSRSRSRKTSDNNYELMDEDGSRSKRSSRSKSRTRRSRSRSRQRSSSKSRPEKKREEEPVAIEPTVLV